MRGAEPPAVLVTGCGQRGTGHGWKLGSQIRIYETSELEGQEGKELRMSGP